MRGIKRFKQYLGGFSLAEMLLVLLIMSFLSMAIAPFVTKKVKKDTFRQPHGRFECFYNEMGRLTQYYVLEQGRGVTEDRTAQGFCEFEPVERAAFFLVQGVAGGGGGAYAATAPYVHSNTSSYPVSSQYDEVGYSVSEGYYIPCSRVRSGYSSTYYRECSGSIINSFSDNSSDTSKQWSWVNDIWNDPQYTPKRTITFCAGRGGGGDGVGGFLRVPDWERDEDGKIIIGPDGNGIDKCEGVHARVPGSDGVDNDPCYDYPTADGGEGGDGGCITLSNIPLPLGSIINRSNLNYYFAGSTTAGKEIYVTYGSASCFLSGGERGGDGKKPTDPDCTGWCTGAKGRNVESSVYTDDGQHQCDYEITDWSTGGKGGIGGIWNSLDGSISFSPKPGENNTNNSFSFSQYYVPISYTYKRAYNYYGMAGGPGEYNMMFFPEIKKSIRIVPGRFGQGGTGTTASLQGQSGGNTTATFEGDALPFLTLRGGRGSAIRMSGRYFQLKSQSPVYNNDTEMVQARTGEYSDFVAALSADEGTNLQSIIPSNAKPGRGGDGGYTILRDTRNGGSRSFDGHTFSSTGNDEKFTYGQDAELPADSSKRIVCHETGPEPDEQKYAVEGSQTVCPGQDGENGAVIIIW